MRSFGRLQSRSRGASERVLEGIYRGSGRAPCPFLCQAAPSARKNTKPKRFHVTLSQQQASEECSCLRTCTPENQLGVQNSCCFLC